MLAVWLAASASVATARSDAEGVAAPERVIVSASPWAHAVEFALVLPDGFDAQREYPVAVLLPPGRQDGAMVSAALETYVRDESRQRGWVVAAASAPGGASWLDVPSAEFERLLMRIAERLGVESGRFHLIGVSSGGRAALRFAVALPGRSASVTVLPGYLEPEEMVGLPADVPMRGFVGERDEAWKSRTQSTAAAWREAGGSAEVEVLAGQEHILKGLTPRRLFDSLEHARLPESGPTGLVGQGGPGVENGGDRAARGAFVPTNLRAEAKVWGLLDRLHATASSADEAGYFACFDDEAVMVGTDPGERWTVGEFRERCQRAFASGKGWIFRVERRWVRVGEGADWAWFEEDLTHARHGRLRGVGVAVRVGGEWKVARYALSVPIPNRDLEHLTTEIRR